VVKKFSAAVKKIFCRGGKKIFRLGGEFSAAV
jgi:hypothetical protein